MRPTMTSASSLQKMAMLSDLLVQFDRQPAALEWVQRHVNSVQKLELMRGEFCFGDRCLKIEEASKIHKLFSLFVHDSYRCVTKKELLATLYHVQNFELLSDRMQRSLEHNLIKTLSRARKLASMKLCVSEDMIRWFPYDPCRRAWTLYRHVW